MRCLSLKAIVNRINPSGRVQLFSQIIVTFSFKNKEKMRNLLKNFCSEHRTLSKSMRSDRYFKTKI